MAHILVVDDDQSTRRVLQAAMAGEGHSVAQAGDGLEALALHRQRPAALIILDINMPRATGLDVLKTLRDAEDPVAVLMLTSEGAELDRLHGFMLGADDYVVKPHSPMELRLRVRGILKRLEPAAPTLAPLGRSGSYAFDLLARAVTREGQPLVLTRREFQLFHALVEKAGATCTRADLLKAAWPADGQPSLRTVDAQVARLRTKLDPEDRHRPIVTVSGEGYRWALPIAPEEPAPNRL